MTDAGPQPDVASAARRITFAVFAMWLSRIAAILLGLVLMPLLFARLPKADLGVWLLLSQSGMMILLLDFGLTSTLIRRFAFLQGDALAADDDRRREAARSFARLAATGRRLYFVIAAGVGGACWLAGLAFISTLELEPRLLLDADIAWSLICVGQMIALSNGLWTAAISGLGHVAPISILAIAFNAATILAQCGVVLVGYSLTALAVAGALGSVGFRVTAVAYLRRREQSLAKLDGRWDRKTAIDLLAPSLKYFVTEMGALLLMRTNPFFITTFLDPASLPVYAANYVLAFNAAVISIAIGDAGNVYVSQFWRIGAHERMRALVLRSMRMGVGLMALGAALLLFAGPSITTVWLGEDHFVGLPVMAAFCGTLLVYTQQSLLFGFSRATEHEVYAGWFLVAGALNVGLSFALTPTFGLVGVAVSTLVAQAATTGWRIPLIALRRLDIPRTHYLSHVLAPVAALFAAACAAIWAATYGPGAPDAALAKVAASVIAGGAVGAIGLWTLALDDEQRAQARRAVTRIGRRAIAPGE